MTIDQRSIILRGKGQSLFRLDKFEEAITVFTEAIELSPEFADAYIDRAKVYSATKEYADAITDCTKAIEIEPSVNAYYSRARSYFDNKDNDKAIADLTEALKIQPDAGNVLDLLGDLYHKKSGIFGKGSTEKGATYRRYKDKFDTLNLSSEVKATIERELQKLNMVNELDIPFSPQDFSSIQNYLDTVLSLPWDDDTEQEQFTLKNAGEILDKEHYGLWDVKNRILEFLSVRKMQKNNKGAILCFAGPPGTGKTSIGKSIADTLGRKFYRFAVGGINDVSAIRGGRRMWIGSEPGRIIKGLISTQSKSPVILIDEVDKITSGAGINGGDPSSALLEVLDPEQNNTFRDSYIDIPFDISNVLFILTANEQDKMPKPLLDRLEIINFSGYVEVEKLQIAKMYLITKNLEKNGLMNDQVSYTDEAIIHTVNSYEREPGVRKLEQNFDKIHRKLVRQIIEQQEQDKGESKKVNFVLGKEEVEKYLGKPLYGDAKKDMQKADRPGISVGLAVLGSSGVPVLIETIFIPGEEGYTITGNMMHIMKESVDTAFSYARKYAIEHNYRDRSWFKENHIHIHFPTANPKDGNSAGIAITTALLSLFKDAIITQKIVMTGEITLTGQVLAIGGLKEKIIGAKNNNAEHIIFPKQNLRDLDETPDIVKEGIQFHPVERFEEVLALMLP